MSALSPPAGCAFLVIVGYQLLDACCQWQIGEVEDDEAAGWPRLRARAVEDQVAEDLVGRAMDLVLGRPGASSVLGVEQLLEELGVATVRALSALSPLFYRVTARNMNGGRNQLGVATAGRGCKGDCLIAAWTRGLRRGGEEETRQHYFRLRRHVDAARREQVVGLALAHRLKLQTLHLEMLAEESPDVARLALSRSPAGGVAVNQRWLRQRLDRSRTELGRSAQEIDSRPPPPLSGPRDAP